MNEQGGSPGPRGLIKRLLAEEGSSYAGIDALNARRMTALLCGLSTVLMVAFLTIEHPTMAIGDAGWAVAGGLAVAGIACAAWLAARSSVSFDVLLGLAYAGLAATALVDWLAGGGELVYATLLVFWVCAGMGGHPPRRAAIFLLVSVAVACLPLAYGSREDVGFAVERDVLLVIATGIAVSALMIYIRAQRLRLRAGRDKAEELARADALTGVGNRRAFDEALRGEVARTRRAGSPLSVALVDLDGFKGINDRYGHLEGDRYLRQVARIVKRAIREGDRCFRWGGDELAVLLPDTPQQEAERVLARIASAVRNSVATLDGDPLGISYGLAELGSNEGPEEVVNEADRALLAQKEERYRV